jgi:hypothetical protein
VLSETGLVGLLLITIFLMNILWSVSGSLFHVKQNLDLNYLAFCIVFLALGDHYFISIPQGIFMFWIFGGLASLRVLNIDKIK